jgi:hypothetical protein
MRTSSCQIEFGNGANGIGCGEAAVAECAGLWKLDLLWLPQGVQRRFILRLLL